jgi:acyl carrier protein
VDAAVVGDDTSLINEGIVDSTGMLELIAFLEGEYDIAIQDREMTPDNLETLNRIGAFVNRKRSAAAPGLAKAV